ncbi:HNH endonuclease [Desulfuromonas sp. AOP6]|nr:HNH endonuclease [Desulfuromonas sp. AOP6]
MTNLTTAIKHFTSLNRAPGVTWTEATKRKAPHKPILLLAVLDLVHRGVVTNPFIDVTADLVELNELFNLYWRRVVPLGQTSSIAFPFSRLAREPFWELVPQPGKTVSSAIINNTSSVSYLRKYALGAKLDDELFQVMQSGQGREALRETLLQSCFSMDAAVLLREQSLINGAAYDYSRVLEEKAHLPLVKEIVEAESYRPAVRDQAFRKVVTTAYDHRCALCGIRIVTPDGHTVVEAAHIVPWSKSKNDDIRNGMALCRTCHWGFDEGMLGVADNYTVITARTIGSDPNYPGLLTMLSGRAILPPAAREYWPAQEYLREHRKEWRL